MLQSKLTSLLKFGGGEGAAEKISEEEKRSREEEEQFQEMINEMSIYLNAQDISEETFVTQDR